MLHLPCFLWNLWVKSAECTKNDPFIKFLFSLYNWLTHHRSPRGHIAQKGVSRMREQSGRRRGNKDSAFVWVCRLPWLVSFELRRQEPSQADLFPCLLSARPRRCDSKGDVLLVRRSHRVLERRRCNCKSQGARGRAGGGKGCSDNLDPSAVCSHAR